MPGIRVMVMFSLHKKGLDQDWADPMTALHSDLSVLNSYICRFGIGHGQGSRGTGPELGCVFIRWAVINWPLRDSDKTGWI